MTDCFSAPHLVPIEQAKKNMLDNTSTITNVETVQIELASGRVLSEAVFSKINVPPFNNSAMDGYAIRDDQLTKSSSSSRKQFTLIGTALAGEPYKGELKDGECIRIMTGAVVPYSANAVVMQENTNSSKQLITLIEPVKLGHYIRHVGGDIAQGQTVFKANRQLKTVDIGLLASLGVAKINVYQKLKVAVLSTGDELKTLGDVLQLGDIFESNRYVLMAMLAKLPIEIIDLGIIADSKADLSKAFSKADELADVVICSGGVSVGDADHVKEILNEQGHIDLWKIAIKPGKPFAFGKLANSHFFGLPGNPVSATVTFHQLVVPVLEKLLGITAQKPLILQAICLKNIKKRAGRADYQRGIASTTKQGELTVTPLLKQASNILSSMSDANCYILLDRDSQGCQQDELIEILMFDHLLQ